VHASELVRITDTLCAAHAEASWGAEEQVCSPQVVFVRRGLFRIRSPRGAATGDAATALLMNGGEPYQVRHPDPGGDHCTAMAFREDVLEEVLTAVGPGGAQSGAAPFARTQAPVAPSAMLRHHALLRRLGVPADPLAIDEHALALLATLLRAPDEHAPSPQPPRRGRTSHRWSEAADEVRRLLATDSAHDHSLAALARRVHTTPFHLTRVFRWRTGSSIHDYRTRLRLAAALRRLAARETSLTRLALDLGFSSHAHFTRRFRALTGMSPSQFRALPRD
jgi:AraC-like DNA-binding protein